MHRKYEDKLRACVNVIWSLSADMTYAELASRAGLHPRTVTALLSGDTKSPQHRTVVQLLWAVGLDLRYEKTKGQKKARLVPA